MFQDRYAKSLISFMLVACSGLLAFMIIEHVDKPEYLQINIFAVIMSFVFIALIPLVWMEKPTP